VFNTALGIVHSFTRNIKSFLCWAISIPLRHSFTNTFTTYFPGIDGATPLIVPVVGSIETALPKGEVPEKPL